VFSLCKTRVANNDATTRIRKVSFGVAVGYRRIKTVAQIAVFDDMVTRDTPSHSAQKIVWGG
jgi:hypothetical protein